MSKDDNSRPKRWVAAALSVAGPYWAMLYVAQPGWAGLYLLAALAIAVLGFMVPGSEMLGLPALAFMVIGAVHAFRLAGRFPAQGPRPLYSRWYGLLALMGLGVALVLGVRSFVVEPFRVPSSSMEPTLVPGAKLLVAKWGGGGAAAGRQRGDLLVFHRPGSEGAPFLGRLIGLPGDEVAYRAGVLSINGQRMTLRAAPDRYNPDSLRHDAAFVEALSGVEYTVLEHKGGLLPPPPLPVQDFPFSEQCSRDAAGLSCRVPAGHFFIMGDNRANSFDSRSWGFLPADHVLGRVVYIAQ